MDIRGKIPLKMSEEAPPAEQIEQQIEDTTLDEPMVEEAPVEAPAPEEPEPEVTPESPSKPVSIDVIDDTSKVIIEHSNEYVKLYLDACDTFDVRANTKIMELLKNSDGTEECVDISSNYIGDRGMLAFAHALSKHGNIVELNVSSNGIRNKGVQALCEVFKGSATLQHINLEKNYISHTGGVALLDHIGSWPSIQSVNVAHNKIDPDTRLKIQKAIRK